MKLFVIFLSTWLLPTICHCVCFTPYWGIETQQCQKFGINFTGIPEKFGIVQNKNGRTNGEKIVMLLQPGIYPLISVDDDGYIEVINDGVPQNIHVNQHLEKLKYEIDNLVDPDFAGIGIIQLLHGNDNYWKMFFDQNWGSMDHYRMISYNQINPDLEEEKRWKLAEHQYEDSVNNYMEKTIRRVKELRPKALWGFDDFPNCFGASFTNNSSCSYRDMNKNDRWAWFWKLQDVFVTLVHSYDESDTVAALNRIGTKVHEVKRIVREYNPQAKIIFHMDLSREDGAVYYSKEVVSVFLRTMIDYDCDGVYLSDKLSELASADDCQILLDHLNNELGPQIKKELDYAKMNGKRSCSNEHEMNTSSSTTTTPRSDSGNKESKSQKKPNFQPTHQPWSLIFYALSLCIILMLP